MAAVSFLPEMIPRCLLPLQESLQNQLVFLPCAKQQKNNKKIRRKVLFLIALLTATPQPSKLNVLGVHLLDVESPDYGIQCEA